LQRSTDEYDINTNLNLFILSVEDQPKLASVAQSLYRESEADAQTAFAVQELISPTNSLDAQIANEITSIVKAENGVAANLMKLSANPSLADETKFLGGYAYGVYKTSKEMQSEATASADSATTNSISKSNIPTATK
jgi:hypothetical protein